MKKFLSITLLCGSLLIIGSLDKSQVKASEKTDTVTELSSIQSNTHPIDNNQSLKITIFEDTFKYGLNLWNISGYVNSNELGAHFLPGASATIKYPIFLQQGNSYPFQFNYYSTSGTPRPLNESFEIRYADQGGQVENWDVTLPASPIGSETKTKEGTFVAKRTGFYYLEFRADDLNKTSFGISNFSISKN